MSDVLCGCGRPIGGDGYLCWDCTDDLRDRLYGCRALVDDLEVALCRMARVGGEGPGIRVRAAEQPLAFSWPAAEAMVLVQTTLETWCWLLAEVNRTTVEFPRPYRPHDPRDPARIFSRHTRTVALAAWLAERIDWLRANEQAVAASEQLNYAIETARAVIDKPVDRAYAGPCLEPDPDGDDDVPCSGELYALAGATVVRCPRCRAEHDMALRRAWLLRAAEDQLLSAAEASRALPSLLGRPVTAAMIRGYAHRGRLVAHPAVAAGRNLAGQAIPVYRVGDVVAVIIDVEIERNAKEQARLLRLRLDDSA